MSMTPEKIAELRRLLKGALYNGSITTGSGFDATSPSAKLAFDSIRRHREYEAECESNRLAGVVEAFVLDSLAAKDAEIERLRTEIELCSGSCRLPQVSLPAGE